MNVSNLDGLSPIPDDLIDTRSDYEISQQLTAYCPPTASNQNVGAYWRTGYNTMPSWTQRNLINWIRLLGPTWTVRLLDSLPSSTTNVFHFISPHFFPPVFNEEKMTGPYVGVHSRNLVRLALLELYLGCGWMWVRFWFEIWMIFGM